MGGLLIPNTLTVHIDGSGSGGVTSSPAGIDCGNTCSHDFGLNEHVQLTANPAADSYLKAWTLPCPGNTNPCDIVMDGPKAVTATFDLIADFTADQTMGGAPLVVRFTDLSANSPVSWTWGFGDGGSSSLQDPVHVYNTPDHTYEVSLTANGIGSYSVTKPGFITVTACTNKKARVGNTDFTPYDKIKWAYEPANTTGDFVDALGIDITEALDLDQNKSVTLRGGWDCAYSTNAYGRTILIGSLTITDGTVTVENLEIR